MWLPMYQGKHFTFSTFVYYSYQCIEKGPLCICICIYFLPKRAEISHFQPQILFLFLFIYLFLFYAFSLVHWNFQCLDPSVDIYVFYFIFHFIIKNEVQFENCFLFLKKKKKTPLIIKNYFMFFIIKNKNLVFSKNIF